MKNLKSVFLITLALITVSCSLSANTEKEGDPKTGTEKGEVVNLNKADFLSKVFDYEKNAEKWVYEGDKPCIIDFYADWCPPCKKIAPILKDLASVYKNDIVIYKINVDQEQELAAVFGVQNIPTLLFIPKDGQPQIAQGALPREVFVEQIDSFLLNKE
ncbi:thioredoxin [Parabacteroides sp. PF5-9]|uniref:thioredoxin n=1 Tax=Parabacteroides sp. PF5-9 TaxID=1742404 RepID=UPI002473DC39|nr:thioredoxin [Parabacteroides sp. PF5-9]MDH6357389.1 thioredoxin [Parabacteroides sp. PF5-9]